MMMEELKRFMKEKTKILLDALEDIAAGSVDKIAPFRPAPREVLMEWARDALKIYKDLQDERNDQQ